MSSEPERRNLDGLRALPRDVLILSIISFTVAVGFGVIVPVLPVFAKSFGVGNLAVGAVVSAFAVMRLVVSPFCGRIIDWMGERATLAVGIGIVALSSALAGIAQNYPQLLAFRAMGGIGSAMFTVSALTLLLGTTPAQLRGRATAFYQGGFLLGGMAGPAVGGLLANISLTAPFYFYAITLFIAGGVGLAFLQARVTGKNDNIEEPARPLSSVLRDVRYQVACFSNLAQGWNSFGVRNSLIPVLVTSVLLLEPSWTGYAFACAAVVQTLAIGPAGRWIDKRGRRPAMIWGGLLAATSICAVPFAPSIAVLIVILCVYGLASAFLGTAPAALVGDASGGRGGRAVAIFSMCGDVGSILGPLAAGWLADHVSMPVAFGVGAALLLAGSVFSMRLPKSAPETSPKESPAVSPTDEIPQE